MMSVTVKGYTFTDQVVDEIIRDFLNGDHARTKRTMIDLVTVLDVPEDVIEAAAKRFLKIITDSDMARFDAESYAYRVVTIDQIPAEPPRQSDSTDILRTEESEPNAGVRSLDAGNSLQK